MNKEYIYTYLGTNGILTTPIHLEGIYSTCKVKLTTKTNKWLTKDGINFYSSVHVPEEDVLNWYEVNKQ